LGKPARALGKQNLRVTCPMGKVEFKYLSSPAYPPHGRLTEIPRGRRVSKAQFFKGKYGNKMEFPEGVGD